MQGRQPAGKVGALQQWCRRIDAAHCANPTVVLQRPLRGMSNHLGGTHDVIGQVCRPDERNFGTPSSRHFGDFRIVGGDYYSIE